jgi:magnesium transporter
MGPVVNCAAYAGGKRVEDLDLDRLGEAVNDPERFVWIGLHEPDEALLKRVQVAFGLHDLAVEDALRAHQRPKLERYDHALFLVLRTAQLGARREPADGAAEGARRCRIEFGETHLFVGPRYVVSVRHGPSLSYTGVRQRCEATPNLLAKGPGFVLYALLDFVVDQYFPIVDALEDELDSLEDELFTATSRRETTARIYRLKRDLLEVKHAVSPLVEVCNRLTRHDLDLVPEDARFYFRDVHDHAMRINDLVDTQRELLTTALEANLSLMSVAQSEVQRRLAAWAAIIAVPTMIAGVYGMNFEAMPELHWAWGYPLALGLMFGVCGFLYFYFRRTGWL